MNSAEWIAGSAGVAAGLAAGWLSNTVSRRLGGTRLWRQSAAVARSLISADNEGQLLREYVRLWPALFVFTAKRLAVTVIALSPVVFAFASLALLASRLWDWRATCVEVAPPQQLVVELAGWPHHLDKVQHTIPASAGLDRSAVISVNGGQLRCATLLRKQAYASSWIGRLLLGWLGFEILEPERPFATAPPFLLVRPSRGDSNVLWPYLSDWEFNFFLAVCLASVVGGFVLKPRT